MLRGSQRVNPFTYGFKWNLRNRNVTRLLCIAIGYCSYVDYDANCFMIRVILLKIEEIEMFVETKGNDRLRTFSVKGVRNL